MTECQKFGGAVDVGGIELITQYIPNNSLCCKDQKATSHIKFFYSLPLLAVTTRVDLINIGWIYIVVDIVLISQNFYRCIFVERLVKFVQHA